MNTFITVFLLLYFTGFILALGIVLSAPPVDKSRKIDTGALILTILGSWFSVGICIGVILDYFQDILEELQRISLRR
jgi:hypothetical protein